MESQLQRLIELQTEQNQLLKKHLVRIRFSLLTLLLLTTAVCCCLGFMMYRQHTPQGTTVPWLVLPRPTPYATPGPPIGPPTSPAPIATPAIQSHRRPLQHQCRRRTN